MPAKKKTKKTTKKTAKKSASSKKPLFRKQTRPIEEGRRVARALFLNELLMVRKPNGKIVPASSERMKIKHIANLSGISIATTYAVLRELTPGNPRAWKDTYASIKQEEVRARKEANAKPPKKFVPNSKKLDNWNKLATAKATVEVLLRELRKPLPKLDPETTEKVKAGLKAERKKLKALLGSVNESMKTLTKSVSADFAEANFVTTTADYVTRQAAAKRRKAFITKYSGIAPRSVRGAIRDLPRSKG